MVTYSAGLLVSQSQTNLRVSRLLIVPIISETMDKRVACKLAIIHDSIVLCNKARHNNLAKKTIIMLYDFLTCQ